MRVSLQWLRELVPCPWSVEEQAERLSMAGLEVEEIIDLAAPAKAVVVGRVMVCSAHPDAAKLSVCEVDVGAAEPLHIVCGARNVKAGIHVPVAIVGCVLPAVDLTIRATTLRGVVSEGMICSLAELGQEDKSEGICVLDEHPAAALSDVPAPGTPVNRWLGLDDVILDVAVTANRPDGLSMVGIARELAALCGSTVTAPQAPTRPATALTADQAAGRFVAACPFYSLTSVGRLTVAPSPLWLQWRLERAGLRSINNVVDITNLVMLETGQPMHAFDAAKVTGGAAAVHVRCARQKEKLESLDGEVRHLCTEQLVVADADGPIALAGVMGGASSQITETTREVLLEVAVFEAAAVRRSARHAGLRTESSSRFERGVPPQGCLAAADRATALLMEWAGGVFQERQLATAEGVLDAVAVALRRQALHRLLGPLANGEPVADEVIERCLQALGCRLSSTVDGWLATIPFSRCQDLQREVDLIEEVARLVGYDRFMAQLPATIAPGGRNERQTILWQLRQRLMASGLQELSHLSLDAGSTSTNTSAGTSAVAVPIANPLSSDYSHLRTELHSGLLRAARTNRQQGNGGLWGFEVGAVFASVVPKDPVAPKDTEEHQRLGAVLCGQRQHSAWRDGGKLPPLDFHSAVGVVERVLASVGVMVQRRPDETSPEVSRTPASSGGSKRDLGEEDVLRNADKQPDDPLLHPGRRAALWLETSNGKEGPVGWFGQLHPRMASHWDLPEDVFLFDADLTAVLDAASQQQGLTATFQPFSLMPAAERDLAVVVKQTVGSGEVMAVIRETGAPLLETVQYLSRFEGGDLPADACSQAYRLVFRSHKTLSDDEVEAALATVAAALGQRFKAQQRV